MGGWKKHLRRWSGRRDVMVLGLGLLLLLGAVILRGYLRQQRMERFVTEYRARGGYVNRVYSTPLGEWLDGIRRRVHERLGLRFIQHEDGIALLMGGPLTREELALLPQMRTMEELHLVQTPLTPGLIASLRSMKSLQGLLITGSKATDENFLELCRVLAECPDFDSLEINGRTELTQTGIQELSHLKRLKRLSLESPHLGGEVLSMLNGASLTVFGMSGGKLSDADLPIIIQKWGKSLETLDLRNTRITEAGIAQLKQLPELVMLNMDGVPLTESLVAQLRQFPKLKILGMGEISIQTAELKLLAQIPLNGLNLRKTKFADGDFGVFAQFPELRSLFLAGSSVTDRQVSDLVNAILKSQELKGQNGSKLNEFDFSETQVTDEIFNILDRLPQVSVLMLEGTSVTDAGIDILIQGNLLKRKKFSHVKLLGTKVTSKGLGKLKRRAPDLHIWSDPILPGSK